MRVQKSVWLARLPGTEVPLYTESACYSVCPTWYGLCNNTPWKVYPTRLSADSLMPMLMLRLLVLRANPEALEPNTLTATSAHNIMKALKCKTLGGIRTRRLWMYSMYVLHHAQSLTPHHCSSICRVSAPRVQNCIRVRMRSPSVLLYAKYGAIFASSYLACYTPDAKVTSV